MSSARSACVILPTALLASLSALASLLLVGVVVRLTSALQRTFAALRFTFALGFDLAFFFTVFPFVLAQVAELGSLHRQDAH